MFLFMSFILDLYLVHFSLPYLNIDFKKIISVRALIVVLVVLVVAFKFSKVYRNLIVLKLIKFLIIFNN